VKYRAHAAARHPCRAQQSPGAVVLLTALLSSSLLFLLPGAAQAQLVISGNDEYAQLIFDMEPLDRSALTTDEPPQPPAASSPAATEASATDQAASAPASPDSASPDPAFDASARREDLQSLASIEAQIDSAVAEAGLYSALLRERYQALGALQQRLGQHESAIATLDKSVHIARVNGGLYTPDQEADVQRIIDSLQAMGDIEREADYRAYLYYMQQRAYEEGDPRLVAARLAWADWNLHAYQRSSTLNPRSVQLPGNDYMEELVVVRDTRTGDVRFIPRRYVMGAAALPNTLGEASRYALTPEMVVDARLREAKEIYEDLLQSTDAGITDEQRDALRLKLVAGEYAFKRHIDRLIGEFDERSALTGASSAVDPMIMRRGLRESRELLDQEILALETADPADPMALARAYLRQADLHIAWQQRSNAEPWYAKAWAALLQAGLDEAAALAWLHPAPLLPVPEFAVHPHSRELFDIGVDDTLSYRGYIDVSMNLTRDGNVRSADIVAASDETPQRVRRLLLNYLRMQKMRPPLEQGVPVTREDLLMRFHYSY
jgi:hypothetical protein